MLTDRQFNFFKSALWPGVKPFTIYLLRARAMPRKRELNGYPAFFHSITVEYLWKLVQDRRFGLA